MPPQLKHSQSESSQYGRSDVKKRTRYLSMVPALLSAVLASATLLFFCSAVTVLHCSAHGLSKEHLIDSAVPHHPRAESSALLEVFQVYPPVLTVAPDGKLEITDGSSNASVAIIPSKAPSCRETLVVHSFFSSYGQPYVGRYVPPSCSFNRVTWNLTVLSSGRQFDRLGSVSFGDIELFRTSTAEPTAKGIEWTYLKDMTSYLSLFKEPQTIIFDLGNIIDDTYTGPFNVTLTAAFFTADDSIVPADLILPISKQRGSVGQPSYFQVPNDTATSDLTLPRNIKKAILTVSATGQSEEEFWWSNVLQSQVDTFPDYGELYGYSPFREVQAYIDGQLAGVAWPFPIIFTGGVVPGLWRPIVGIDAFDLKEDEIDITPWLPLLCDGKPHSFALRISGLTDKGNGTAALSETTDDYWWVGGKIFVWLDTAGHITTGSSLIRTQPNPTLKVSSNIFKTANGTNDTLVYQVTARRQFSLEATVTLSGGKKRAYWSQDLSYSNTGNYSDQGNVQTNEQKTTGQDVSSSGYAKHYDYPLYAFSTISYPEDNLTLTAVVNRGKSVQTFGQGVFPSGLESFSAVDAVHNDYRSFQGASLDTTQNGTAYYTSNQTAKTSFSFGTTEQDMTFSGVSASYGGAPQDTPKITRSRELFRRHVMAVNGTVVDDRETLTGRNVNHDHRHDGQELLAYPVSNNGGRFHHGL